MNQTVVISLLLSPHHSYNPISPCLYPRCTHSLLSSFFCVKHVHMSFSSIFCCLLSLSQYFLREYTRICSCKRDWVIFFFFFLPISFSRVTLHLPPAPCSLQFGAFFSHLQFLSICFLFCSFPLCLWVCVCGKTFSLEATLPLSCEDQWWH